MVPAPHLGNTADLVLIAKMLPGCMRADLKPWLGITLELALEASGWVSHP